MFSNIQISVITILCIKIVQSLDLNSNNKIISKSKNAILMVPNDNNNSNHHMNLKNDIFFSKMNKSSLMWIVKNEFCFKESKSCKKWMKLREILKLNDKKSQSKRIVRVAYRNIEPYFHFDNSSSGNWGGIEGQILRAMMKRMEFSIELFNCLGNYSCLE